MPRDLTKKMQSAAGDDEDFAVPVDEDMEGPMKARLYSLRTTLELVLVGILEE